jgi:capsular polysaccharide transport system permease protein
MFKALRTQLHVIAALTIRGMQNERKKFKYGYVWAFIQPASMIFILRFMMRATGLEPTGMGATTYVVIGVFGIFMFLQTMASTSFRSSRRGLLIIPRVTTLDMLIANALQAFVLYTILFWLFVIPSSIIDGDWPPEDPLGVQVALIADWLLGLSFAFTVNAMSRYFPPITEFKKFISRTLRLISGMFFTITSLPYWLWPYFTWNPVLHITELMRSYWFTVYTTPIGSLPFVFMWVGGLTLLGLSLERYLRRAIPE